jgi:hypothetical protein
MYRDYKHTFTEASGLPFHGQKNENAFCAFLAGGKSSCSFCRQTESRVAESPGKLSTFDSVPIWLD